MLNSVTIQGRLVRDIELRRTQNGVACASFTLAVDEDFKNDRGEKTTQFIDCVAWRAPSEILAQYAFKGMMLIVNGRLQIREYTDKNGQKRRAAEILVDKFYFCEKRESSVQRTQQPYGAAPAPAPVQNFQTIDDDSELLPF